jgi:hypothetical protein
LNPELAVQPQPQMQPQPQQQQGLQAARPTSAQPIPQSLHVSANNSVGLSTGEQPTLRGLPGHRQLEFINAWGSAKGTEIENMNEADRFYDLNTWTDEEKAVLAERNQAPSNIPLCHVKIDAYIGITHRLRRDPKAHPRTFSKTNRADAATAALRYVDERTFGKQRFNDAAKDFFCPGIGVICQTATVDEDGVTFHKRHVPRVNFIYDPRSMAPDFSDAKFIGEWNWLDIDDAVAMLAKLGRQDSAARVTNMADGEILAGASYPFVMGQMDTWWDSTRKRIRLCLLYYRYKNNWRCSILCGKDVLYDEVSIYVDEKGKTYQPYNAMSCYLDPQTGERYGAMKVMIPLQRQINFLHSKLTFLSFSQRIIYEEGAVDDINDFKREVNLPNGVVKVMPSAISGKKIQAEPIQAQIEAAIKLLQHAEERLMAIGPNPALLGKGDGAGSQSGRAILALQNAGMAEMSTVFERHRDFKLEAYRRDWLLIKQFWRAEPNIPIRVLDDEEQAKELKLNVPMAIDFQTGKLIYDNSVEEMDVEWVLDEGTDTTIIKEEMMQFISQAGNMPLPRLKTMIYLSGIPNHKMLFKLLDEENPKPNPEMDELQKKAAYLEGMLNAAKVDAEIAKTEKIRVDALAAMSQNMLSSQMLQAFPLDYGVRSNVEDFLDQDIHPFGNAFSFEPPPQMEPMPMTDGPMQAGPDGAPMPGPPQPAEMQQKPAPQLVNRQEPNMPGDMPVMGGEGGLPLPPPGQGGLAPPPGTRA